MKPTPEIHRRDCSPEELRAIKAIAGGPFCPAFANEAQLIEHQRSYLWSIVWRFRAQIADKDLVGSAEKWHIAEQIG